MPPKNPPRPKPGGGLYLLGVSISCLPRNTQILLLGGLMMGFQVGHGILTEYVATGVLAGLMWFSAAAELLVYALFAAGELAFSSGPCLQNVPWGSYALISILIALGRGLTWVGYGTLSFPLVLLFKSSKLVAVMVAGALYLRNRFKALEYFAALLIVAGEHPSRDFFICNLPGVNRIALCSSCRTIYFCFGAYAAFGHVTISPGSRLQPQCRDLDPCRRRRRFECFWHVVSFVPDHARSDSVRGDGRGPAGGGAAATAAPARRAFCGHQWVRRGIPPPRLCIAGTSPPPALLSAPRLRPHRSGVTRSALRANRVSWRWQASGSARSPRPSHGSSPP